MWYLIKSSNFTIFNDMNIGWLCDWGSKKVSVLILPRNNFTDLENPPDLTNPSYNKSYQRKWNCSYGSRPEILGMAVAFSPATFSHRLSPKHFSKIADNASRVSIVLTRLQRTGGATDCNQLNYIASVVLYNIIPPRRRTYRNTFNVERIISRKSVGNLCTDIFSFSIILFNN